VATIRASCPTCDDVDLTTEDLTVVVCADTTKASYAFCCPSCRRRVVKEAEARIVDLLLAAGVKKSVWALPAELYEPKLGLPITYDDLLEFHFLLERPDALQGLVEAAPDDAR
jgi:hypothetical protein